MKKLNHKNQKRTVMDLFLRKYSRKGVVILVVLVSLITVSLISGTMIKQTLTTEKLAQRESNRVQAAWLTESGIERGLFRLKSNKEYSGETWKLSMKEIGMNEPGEILISVLNPQNSKNYKQLKVTATYPLDSVYRTVQTKTIPVAIKNQQ